MCSPFSGRPETSRSLAITTTWVIPSPVHRPSTGQWIVDDNGVGHVFAVFGGPTDFPAPGDYDGVGHTEPAVFRPSTDQWFVDKNGVGRMDVVFGGPGDVPVPGDYDGVGHAELAIFRPSTAAVVRRRARRQPPGEHLHGAAICSTSPPSPPRWP